MMHVDLKDIALMPWILGFWLLILDCYLLLQIAFCPAYKIESRGEPNNKKKQNTQKI